MGGATAANQYEGFFDADNRGLSNVDFLPNGKNRLAVARGDLDPKLLEKGEVYPFRTAVKGYSYYQEDIALMAEMGCKVYRFSISWSRIFPNGDDQEPNELGLQYYEKVVDECLKYGIEPLITINHFDVPYHLIEKYGSWRNPIMIDLYLNLCKVLYYKI